jgi:dephospho-CoA kinase
MTKLKLIAGVLALAVAFGGGWTSRGWLADRDKAAREAAAERQARAAVAAEVEAGRKALAEREDRIKDLTETNRIMSEKLREAYAKDPEARAWADSCLPDSIECLLR